MTPNEREIEQLCADFISGDRQRWAPAGDRLMEIGMPAFLPLTRAYGAADVEVREAMNRLFFSILKHISYDRAFDFFKREATVAADQKARLAAVKIIHLFGAPGIDALVSASQDLNAEVRETARTLLADRRPTFEQYAELLMQPDVEPERRWQALAKLAAAGDAHAIEPLLGILQRDKAVLAQFVGDEAYLLNVRRHAAAYQLGKQRVVAAVPALIDCLHETTHNPVGNWDHQTSMTGEAADALVRIGQAALPALREAAEQHANAAVRAEAQRLVGFIAAKHPPQMPYVTDERLWEMYEEAMQGNTDFEQRWYLLVRLVHRGDPRAIETLIGVLRRNTDTLPGFLKDKTFTENFKRHEAAFMFGKLKIEVAIPALIAALSENQPAPAGSWQHQTSMAHEAFDALVRIGQPALPALREAAQKHGNTSVRQTAADLVAHISANKPVPRRWVLDEP